MLDLAIIGGGPAGLTAGLYAKRGGLKNVLLFDFGVLGGQITSSSEIENYPGQSKPIMSGLDFMYDWINQVKNFNLECRLQKIEQISIDRIQDGFNIFKLLTSDGEVFFSKSVLFATGSTSKKAGFIGEKEFFGRGVSTCATCDGFFYKNQDVAVIGGGDSALEEAFYLSKICKTVYLISRSNSYNAAPSTIKRIKDTDNIVEIENSVVEEVFGDKDGVTGLFYKNKESNVQERLDINGVFVFVGRDVLNTSLKQDNGKFLCNVNDRGEISVNLKMKTSVPGLYAAGDIRSDSSKQVVCAAGDGATAAVNIIEYLG